MNSSMRGPCPQVRAALGVYVLGAIDPGERSQVDAHLSTCPSCRDELAGLAGLPALLSRVGESQIADVADPPVELLDSLLAKAAAQRRAEQAQMERAELQRSEQEGVERRGAELRERRARRRRHWPAVGVAAAVLLLAGMLLGGLVTGRAGGPSGAAPVPHSTSVPARPPVAPITDVVTQTDPQTHVRAQIKLDEKEWGTALTVKVDGAPPGVSCHLYAVAKDGSRDAAAGWRIEAQEYGDFYGSTMISRDRLASFEVVTTDGHTLVTIPVPPL